MRKALAVAALLSVAANAQAADYFEPTYFATGYFETNYFEAAAAGPVAVPNVVGEASFAAADTILEGDGLDGGTETEVCSAAANNEIVGQSIAAGTLVAGGTLINLRSSNGMACPDSGGAEIILRRRR